jgi:4-amino-4-deoxy-L-arabinose transferase-like glycosyltransferase
MPRETATAGRRLAVLRRWWPEALLAVLAGVGFLGCLGSVELWGKREQRATAEAIDTIDHHHWLVAEIQGRPRLEKPPLPRWSIATLLLLTGRRDEWIIRLPGALAGMATVALIYALGRRMAGRALGLASAFILCSTGFFVGEMRQASNDCLLALFVTLALYAAYRRLHDKSESTLSGLTQREPRSRAWNLIFYSALGLGFLTKGPIILLLVGVAIVPYLAFARRLTSGLPTLGDGWGLSILLSLALGWPAAVLVNDPGALRVWSLEMSEKTGLSRILEHRWHAPLIGEWPGLVLPWTLIAAVAVLLPVVSAIARANRERTKTPGPSLPGEREPDHMWFAWWWAVGNLLLFCTWVVAKPNYYLPCLPGMALLTGSAWLRLARAGRGDGKWSLAARAILQAQWVLMFVAAVVAPLVVRASLPASLWPWSVAIGVVVAGSVPVSVHFWRRGADAAPLAPIAAACVVGVLIAYGKLAPAENELRSHRALARELQQIVPAQVRTINFFNEIDEGLWFYIAGINLAPVPGTHPRYNTAYDLAHSFLNKRQPHETIGQVEVRRQARDKQALLDWVERSEPNTSYLLIRGSLYDGFAADLAGCAVPLFRETGLKRNELVLLKVTDRRTPAVTAASSVPTRH